MSRAVAMSANAEQSFIAYNKVYRIDTSLPGNQKPKKKHKTLTQELTIERSNFHWAKLTIGRRKKKTYLSSQKRGDSTEDRSGGKHLEDYWILGRQKTLG